MSDDYEERIREDWYYTYKAWDAADDRRRLERQNEITRLGAEGSRLDREIARTGRARELQEWIERFQRDKKFALRQLDGLDTSAVPESYKTEWHQELDRINPRNPRAKLQVQRLIAKVNTFTFVRTEFTEALKTPRIEIESQSRSRLYFDEQVRRGAKAENDLIRSSLGVVVVSLRGLASDCGVIQQFLR